MFLANDKQRYVLDPLRGEKIVRPQLLTTYLAHEEFGKWTIYVSRDMVINDEVIVIQHPSEFEHHIKHGKCLVNHRWC